jgi:hypothetical protein
MSGTGKWFPILPKGLLLLLLHSSCTALSLALSLSLSLSLKMVLKRLDPAALLDETKAIPLDSRVCHKLPHRKGSGGGRIRRQSLLDHLSIHIISLCQSTGWVKRESEKESARQAAISRQQASPTLPSWMGFKGGSRHFEASLHQLEKDLTRRRQQFMTSLQFNMRKIGGLSP